MKKPSALDEYLKDHKRHCALRTRYSDPARKCSCGRDEAVKELDKLRRELQEAREDEREL